MCRRAINLGVYHINNFAGNGLNNARVLCQKCYNEVKDYKKVGDKPPPPFSEETIQAARKAANFRCQCPGCKSCLNEEK